MRKDLGLGAERDFFEIKVTLSGRVTTIDRS